MAAAWSPGELGPLLRFLERRLSRASALTLTPPQTTPKMASSNTCKRQAPAAKKAAGKVAGKKRAARRDDEDDGDDGDEELVVVEARQVAEEEEQSAAEGGPKRRRKRVPWTPAEARALACPRGLWMPRPAQPLPRLAATHRCSLPQSLREWRLAHARPRCTHLPASGHPRRRARGDGAGASFGGGS